MSEEKPKRQLSVKDVQKRFNSEKFDVVRGKVFVLMPNDALMKVVGVSVTQGDVFIIVEE